MSNVTGSSRGSRPAVVIQKNSRVAILNQTLSGKFIVEGYATVLRKTDVEGMYTVKFDDGNAVDRFVDRAAQADPKAYVAEMNASFAQRTGDQP